MPERKSIYFQDDIMADLHLRIGHRSHKASTVVTDSLGWYFRMLRYVGVSEMSGVFTLGEVHLLALVALRAPQVEVGGLESAKITLVDGLKAKVDSSQAIIKKVSGLSPAAVIWLWDCLTILHAAPVQDWSDEWVSALFRVGE